MLQQIKNMIGQNVDKTEETDKEDTSSLKVTSQQYQSPYSNASIEFAFKHGKGQRNYSPLDNEIKEIKDQQLIKSLVRSYQTRGHISASVDPLGKSVTDEDSEAAKWRRFFPNEASLDTIYLLPETTFIGGGEVDRLPLREIIRRLEAAYCGCVGAEYSLVESFEERQWLRQHLEPPIVYEGSRHLSTGERLRTLERLIHASAFELFLASFWGSEPRFGVEGCEILIPALCQLIDVSAGLGVDTFVIGMPHRGRLNVLANVCHVPLHKIFALFAALPQGNPGSGDVKYHLGTYREFECPSTGKKVRVSLMCNPSHLEAISPVVLGRTRAEQRIRGDENGSKVMCIIVHGDAALSGQGVAYECVQLSKLAAYSVHGTIHVVLNNQMGSTTDPGFYRSSRYCTDVFRVTATPVLHVNADVADAVIRCCNVAASYRNKFKKDVVLDLVAYRRYGHTEHDDPSVVQPMRYKKIEGKCSITKMYQEKLQGEGLVSAATVKKILKDFEILCTQEISKAQRETCHRMREWCDVPPERWIMDSRTPFSLNTGVEPTTLCSLAEALLQPPANIDLHVQVKQLIASRLEKLGQGHFDWAMAESFAVATLLIQGVHVRFTGQDIQTGMFSGRNWILYDQSREGFQWVPLQKLPGAKATLEFSNSPVAEYSTMGFEVGYSTSSPNQLVMWEAQFGDFCNLAQCVIDQFLSAGESKWGQSCGLVLLCPHGLEGAGPEHSSGRLERFLQLCSDDQDVFPDVKNPTTPLRQLRAANLVVVNCSTPANLFHLLRLQATTPVRKPLILFTHKTLLKHPSMVSNIQDISLGTQFQRVLSEADTLRNHKDIVKLIFCTGRIYYDLCEERANQGLENCVAIARIEQLSPFPYDRVYEEIKRFPNATLIWVQHEHKNQGAWNYVQPRFGSFLPDRPLNYVGRQPSPAPATGSVWRHHLESRQLLETALDISSISIARK